MPADRPLESVVVHGMCTHYPKWASAAANEIIETLGGTASAEIPELPPDATGIRVYQQTYPLGRKSVRISAVLWSPLTVPLKKNLCYDQKKKSAICKPTEEKERYEFERATVNALLKDWIMDDCLADALIYQGRSRDQINERMQAVLTRIAKDSCGPVVLVTDSLGSKVTFDAIDRMIASPQSARILAGTSLRDRTTHVFMRANQIPILRLADLDLDGKPSTSDDQSRNAYALEPISAVFAKRTKAAGDPRPFIVAFSDPNALLSFGIPSGIASGYTLVNVYVSNQPTWFGFVERPDTGHTTYASNPAVRRLMSCGTDAEPCTSGTSQ
jgi:hypothetical protein